MLAVDPGLFAEIHGSTDTEVVFHLALTFGLEDDPVAALERTVGVIESAAEARGVEGAVQATFGVSDGESLWAVRYSTEGRARSLFASADVDADPPAAPRQPALPAPRRRRPPDRLGAVLGPPGRMARDPGGDGRDGAPRRGARGAAVPTRLSVP